MVTTSRTNSDEDEGILQLACLIAKLLALQRQQSGI